MSRFKLLVLSILTALSVSLVAVPTPAFAQSAGKTSACQALDQIGSGQGCGSGSSKTVISGTVSTIITILSFVLGAVAIIMIIVGGFRYITSGGASDKVSGAKNTILYAVLGLIVASLAQFIVRYVLERF